MKCRFCNTRLENVFVDLVNSPASNSFLSKTQLNEPEVFYPLKVYVCKECKLVQVDEYKKSDEIFDGNYAYFSSYSTSWLAHAKLYTEKMIERFGFNEKSQIIEIASNDGYLLQYFKERNVPVLGIEPTSNTAEVAISKGIATLKEFFGTRLAIELRNKDIKADLLLGNNVLAHVPDINDFVEGMKHILNTQGVITMEFPHLMQLVDNNQFDTIYHEHFSYLSLYTVQQIFKSKGLEIFDVEEINTHGGSLRIYAKHDVDTSRNITENVRSVIHKELNNGIDKLQYYIGFQERAEKIKIDLLSFLIEQKRLGNKVAAYGAAAKGNTLLNFCGIKNDLIAFVVDANPHKQNHFLPASHIPVVSEDVLKHEKPDFVIILPWNLKSEITAQLSYINDWNAKFVVAIPSVEIL
jgi:2-polyprenyl-3-methyl-5-hydroxy-6-metoxy-1,4-benzoquinol methylase